jgi:uncharacterized protein
MLNKFVDWLIYSIFNLNQNTLIAQAVHFFIYDTIKIFFLLCVIIFIVSIIRSFFPPERTRNILTHKNKYIGNIIAAILGIVTPFCSCSAVPLFLGFIEAGIPLGITFSFLIASPMINEVALIMLWSMFGLKIALIYILSGLIIAIISGIIIGKLKLENWLETSMINENTGSCCAEIPKTSWKEKIEYAQQYTIDIIRKIWIYVILGIGLGAWIHGYVPSDFLVQYAGKGTWYAVPLAVLLGIPLYSNAAGIIPMISALVSKGVGIGTALAFMMAVTGLSLPEFMILRRVMKVKLLVVFALIVGIGIIITGYIFNFIIN